MTVAECRVTVTFFGEILGSVHVRQEVEVSIRIMFIATKLFFLVMLRAGADPGILKGGGGGGGGGPAEFSLKRGGPTTYSGANLYCK